ncbi:MAG: outer membrane protein transport protein [Sphingobacterium sp.]|nr:outer membrane protein transport protein [Sphingobacterium sp.]
MTGRLTMPREIACGLALRPLPQLSLNLDVEWDRWSEFGRWEFASVNAGGDLSPGFTPVHEEFYGISPDYGVQGFDLAVRDSKKLKAGAEYRLGRWFALRGGFARHESSVDPAGRTPLYPDPGFNLYSFGAGYEGPLYSIWDDEKTVSRLSIEFFIRYAAADEAGSTLPGYEMSYGARRWVGGVGVGFIFDLRPLAFVPVVRLEVQAPPPALEGGTARLEDELELAPAAGVLIEPPDEPAALGPAFDAAVRAVVAALDRVSPGRPQDQVADRRLPAPRPG